MADNNFSFRRATDPLQLPVATTATKFDVPTGYFTQGGPGFGATSFWVCNANNFWVRLRGSGIMTDAGGTYLYIPVTATTGWLFPPGYVGAFSTQYPMWMSTISVSRQGIPAGDGTLEISYGGGN